MRRGRGARKRMAPERAEPAEAFEQDVLMEVRELFSKARGYHRPPGGAWCLPDPCVALRDTPLPHQCLQALKHTLNRVKNQLSDQDLEIWHQHTCSTNRAGTVTAHLRNHANAELCTQAWAKFYEILGTFDLLPEEALQRGELNSVHLCEAPGAFISALNHFLKTRSDLHCDWSWAANSLNPYHEANGRSCTIADDRLIARTLPWWFFGSDDTGDIMLQKHLLELQGFVGNMQSIDLVTADGSFDCQGDPGEQESLVAPLQHCEAVCALLLLSPGGSLVLKMFTLFEHSSVCLLYMLCCCFRSVSVFKPATSKAGNSELYVVCLGYEARDAVRPLLSKLIRGYGPELASPGAPALFPNRCIPEAFLLQHLELCSFFQEQQVGTIQENLRLFAGMTTEQRWRLDRVRECAALFYVQRFQVRPLPRQRWLSRGVGGSTVGTGGGKLCQRKQTGTFNQRREQQGQGWRQRLAQGPYGHCHTGEGTKGILAGSSQESDLDAWFLLVGAALPKIRSSPFCEPELLGLLNEAVEESAGGLGDEVGLLNKDALRCSLVGLGDEEASQCSSVGLGDEASRCGLCAAESPAAILSELCALSDVTSCLVLGSPTVWGVPSQAEGYLRLEFCPCPAGTGFTTLHDGEGGYQCGLWRGVLSALRGLREGGALAVPLRSALTRLIAGLVFALHLCFGSLAFRCCQGDCPPAMLLCTGFSPVPSSFPKLLRLLEEALAEMERLEREGGGRQLLQLAPMEELLKGALPHFLSGLNAAVARQRLHHLLTQPPGRDKAEGAVGLLGKPEVCSRGSEV